MTPPPLPPSPPLCPIAMPHHHHWINALEEKLGFSSFCNFCPILLKKIDLLEAKDHIVTRAATDYGGQCTVYNALINNLAIMRSFFALHNFFIIL